MLREALAQSGQDASVLTPMRRFALKRLIPMSKGRFSDEMIDELVAQAEAYEPGEDHSPADAGAAPSDVELPEWRKQVTPGRFAGRTVVVTGAGSGIGYATASRVAREGGWVIAVDISKPRLKEFAAAHKKFDVVTVKCDITAAQDIAKVVKAAGERVDELANVTGIMDNMTGLHDVGDDVWERVFAVNVDAMMRLTRAVLPGMIAARCGAVVNVGSEASLCGSAAGVAYTASKHAVVGMTKSAAFMYAPSRVRVNMVAPGGDMTGIESSFDSEFAAARIRNALTVMPPRAEPGALAASIPFLLSDDGVNVTGAILLADGGRSAT